ncbi:hypothetical protein DMH18_17515 [Streptomyces sp. WAC 06783]|uniref:hypothetical protein n=1 Tax=Streptomyces sp. WAC 06783 TaxID=2203211 RepID=UPI000F744855|nr:hypothetical protein [Streptomyces sp. WAC 06783]RSO09244.1 hypothetical protein DMH18_17515 [Streptomyces sp. WAC 06783]
MTTTVDDTPGELLAESLMQAASSDPVKAATRLLGAHRDGYWLRRFLRDEQALTTMAGQPVIVRSGTRRSVNWDTVGLLLLPGAPVFRCSGSERAVLEVAASLVTRCGVQLGQVISAVDDRELDLIVQALTETAHGKQH